jgi:hypothetical protein
MMTISATQTELNRVIPTAVVRGRENSDQLSLGKEFVTVLDDLMRTTDKIHVVFEQELANNLGTEGERHTAVVFT